MPQRNWQKTLRFVRSCCTARVRASARAWTSPASCPGKGGTGVLLERDGDRLANFAQRVGYDWSLVPAPVIAAIHGNCFGGGLQIALGADIRIAAPDAKLSIMEIKWGLVPDMGITQTLPRLVPIDVAKELTFSGRIVSGSDALALGLVTRNSDDPLASALALADEIAQKSPDAVRAAKRALRRDMGQRRRRRCPETRIRAAGRADRQAQSDRRRRGRNVGGAAGFRQPRTVMRRQSHHSSTALLIRSRVVCMSRRFRRLRG